MANGFGSLWVGASGLQGAQNALNTTANNMTNVNSAGYVRQQVVYEDREYRKIGTAAISKQQSGLGVDIGEVVHTRDIFLDKAYRTSTGRQAFYDASFDAVSEVQTYLQESDGKAFQSAIEDIYGAFAEFAKDPSDDVNQNLIFQKASLFLSRANAVYTGLSDYQDIVNTSIKDSVKRINEIGEEIRDLNNYILKLEAGGTETAYDLRDKRDMLLDELSTLAKISYKETPQGIVKVQIEGTQFVDETKFFKIGLWTDDVTGFVNPYWEFLSDTEAGDIDYVFDMTKVDATRNNDIGKIKALLVARGNEKSNYLSMYDSGMDEISEWRYQNSVDVDAPALSSSVMMNSEAELDKLVHNIVTRINDLLSPIDTFDNVYSSGTYPLTATDAFGNTVTITDSTRVLDINNCSVGSDNEIPPRELFTRVGTERYTAATVNIDGTPTTIYLYNEENANDEATCYTLKSLSIHSDITSDESLIPYKMLNGDINYRMGAALDAMWDEKNYTLNPSDTTPCSVREFYTMWVGEIGTVGSIYQTTSETLKNTKEQIDSSRQEVIGVSSDEELTNMIKYQNAYNASSRFINTINEMIEHILTSLGH